MYLRYSFGQLLSKIAIKNFAPFMLFKTLGKVKVRLGSFSGPPETNKNQVVAEVQMSRSRNLYFFVLFCEKNKVSNY